MTLPARIKVFNCLTGLLSRFLENMVRKYILLGMIAFCSWASYGQKSYNEQVKAYIEQYKELAVAEQKRTGVPAAIKLAQGIFETGAGSSELCNNAQNHFGIKCKTSWSGETYSYTDDAKDECFRKYPSSHQSYKDHSDFLKNNKRYASLFNLSPTDYAAWAYGLKRCGYATNPAYAKKLIKTIEDFHLQEYTYAALDNAEEQILLASTEKASIPQTKRRVSSAAPGEYIPADNTAAQADNIVAETFDDEIIVEKAIAQDAGTTKGVVDYYQNTSKNGMKGFYARKGDMLLEYAIKNRIRYAKILEYNDLPDAPLEADMFVYLERKGKAGSKEQHKVAGGETLLQISQQEGIQLQQLRSLNQLEKGEEPVAGTILNLREPAAEKPQLYPARQKNSSPAIAATTRVQEPAQKKDSYIATTARDEPRRALATTTTSEGNNDYTETRPAAQQQNVNIANEKPVEDVIAEEGAKKNGREMTALEKLKAHMDKTVYATERKYEPKTSRDYGEVSENQEEEVTPPAANTSSSATIVRKNATPKNTVKPAAASKSKVHTVRKGETLFSIAQKYHVTVSQLQKFNKLGGAKKIVPGMKLKTTP